MEPVWSPQRVIFRELVYVSMVCTNAHHVTSATTNVTMIHTGTPAGAMYTFLYQEKIARGLYMTSLRQLGIEAVVVGAALSLCLAGVASWMPSALRGASTAGLTGLVLGAVLHLWFELTGLNSVYCRVGHACT